MVSPSLILLRATHEDQGWSVVVTRHALCARVTKWLICICVHDSIFQSMIFEYWVPHSWSSWWFVAITFSSAEGADNLCILSQSSMKLSLSLKAIFCPNGYWQRIPLSIAKPTDPWSTYQQSHVYTWFLPLLMLFGSLDFQSLESRHTSCSPASGGGLAHSTLDQCVFHFKIDAGDFQAPAYFFSPSLNGFSLVASLLSKDSLLAVQMLNKWRKYPLEEDKYQMLTLGMFQEVGQGAEVMGPSQQQQLPTSLCPESRNSDKLNSSQLKHFRQTPVSSHPISGTSIL